MERSPAIQFQDVQVLRITRRNSEYLQAKCLRCHGAIAGILLPGIESTPGSCTRCHREVGHGV